jgi:ABC-type phosphate transport system substrate-binding protein
VPAEGVLDTSSIAVKVTGYMLNGKSSASRLVLAAAVFSVLLLGRPALPAVKNLALITSAGSKLQDVALAELAKMCKGTQKVWSDGRSFTLVMKDPASPDMHAAAQKLFGSTPADVKAAVAKLNETRSVVKVVGNDQELLQAVEAIPGAVGLVDVYSINSSIKVLRVDGKLPFDVGYPLKGN